MFFDILNYEGLYMISKKGEIYSTRTNKILKPKVDKDGYLEVTFSVDKQRKTFRVHRLVAETFINNPNNYEIVNHIDGNKSNNEVSNLEWCTTSYNTKYEFDNRDRVVSNKKYFIDVYLDNFKLDNNIGVKSFSKKYKSSKVYLDAIASNDYYNLRFLNIINIGNDSYSLLFNGEYILENKTLLDISEYLNTYKRKLYHYINKENHISKYKIIVNVKSND